MKGSQFSRDHDNESKTAVGQGQGLIPEDTSLGEELKQGQWEGRREGAGDETKRQALEEGEHLASHGRNQLSSQLERLGKALRSGGESLRAEQEMALGDYAKRLGQGCENMANYLRERQPREILDEVSHLVRRNPEVVLGGLFVAGLGIARFLRASNPKSPGHERSPVASHPPAAGETGGSAVAYGEDPEVSLSRASSL